MLLRGYEKQVHASSSALAVHLSLALPLPLPIRHKQGLQQGSQQESQPFITSQAHATLCDSAQMVTRLARGARAADQQHGYSSKAPAWKEALDALQAAAAQSASIGSGSENSRDVGEQQQQRVGESGESSEAVQKLRQQWQTEVESLVKGVLVWAQSI